METNGRSARRKQYLKNILDKLVDGEDERSYVREKLSKLYLQLIDISRHTNPHNGEVNNGIVHDGMMLIMSEYLLRQNFDVRLEQLVGRKRKLRPDVYYSKGDFGGVVEVEYANIASRELTCRMISPEDYEIVRLIGKISRYSNAADDFWLAFSMAPMQNPALVKPVLKHFTTPISERSPSKVDEYCKMSEMIYNHPYIPRRKIEKAMLSGVYQISIKEAKVYPLEI